MKRSSIFTAVLAVAALAGAANANVYLFTGTGNSAGQPVSASASFTTSAGSVTLDLTNTTPHTADAGQLLTGIRFTLANGQTFITGLSPSFTATGAPRDVAGNGTFVDSASTNISWESGANGNGYQFDFNPDAKHAIIGPADLATPTTYTGNGSINGNNGHNPFTGLTGHFSLTGGLITSETVVSNVTFIYNTGLSYTIPGNPPGGGDTPEPASLSVLALGAVALMARRRKA